MKPRAFRCQDDLWLAATRKALLDGGISHVLRTLLRRYVRGQITL